MFYRSKTQKFVYDGALDIPQFKDWLIPRVIDMPFQFDHVTQELSLVLDRNMIFLFLTGDVKRDAKLIEKFGEASKKYTGPLMWSYVTNDQNNILIKSLYDHFGMQFEGLSSSWDYRDPVIVGLKPPKNEMFWMSSTTDKLVDDVDATFIAEFATKFMLDQVDKSEAINGDTESPVRPVSAKMWEDFKAQEDKELIVEFYANWCPWCKKFAADWEEFGATYAKHDDLIVAKIDLALNTLTSEGVFSFPTIMFYPKGKNKQGIKFDGDRNLENLHTWLGEQSKVVPGGPSSSELIKEQDAEKD